MRGGVTVLVLKASGTGRSSKGWVVLAGQPWKHLASAWRVPGVEPAFGGQTLSWTHPRGHAGS